MGVQGLTTYINDRSNTYFENYNLRGTYLIIDGFSLASVLYIDFLSTNSAFGGDYDRYAKCVENVILILKKCDIVPIVMFDGGYENRKLKTVIDRNTNKVWCLEKVAPGVASKLSYPLLMRQVFRDKLLEMGVALAQSDFEADAEIAALAQKLNCPVLSNDSDFFIFDVTYIPLSSISFEMKDVVRNDSVFSIPCKIYKVDKFLDSFGGLSKDMLPLVAVVLGNDYIKKSTFKNFYAQLPVGKTKKNLSVVQNRIGGLLEWLRNETFESAQSRILGCLKKNRRKHEAHKVKRIIKGYTEMVTILDNYLPEKIQMEINAKAEPKTNVPDSNQESENDESSDSEDEDVAMPQWFLDDARRGYISGPVITLISLKTYFFVPQVEEFDLPHAGSIALPLLAALAGLLIKQSITYWSRTKNTYLRAELDPLASVEGFDPLPSLSEIPKLSLDERRKLFLNILGLGSELDGLPEEWKLFFAAVIYWIKKCTPKLYYISSLFFGVIAVNVFNQKIGYYRNKRALLLAHGAKIKKLSSFTAEKYEDQDDIGEAIARISESESLLVFENLLPYFHIGDRLKTTPKVFSRTIVHQYGQFQSVLELTMLLNSVLLRPLEPCQMGNLYNGTLLYNFTANLKKRSNIKAYMETFLLKAPNVLALFNLINQKFVDPELYANSAVKTKKKGKKRKKKPVELDEQESEPSEPSVDEVQPFVDENNPYSLLAEAKS